MLLPLLLILSAAPLATVDSNPTLGTPLKRDGYSVRPPQGFRTARRELFERTRVGAIALNPEADRALSEALMDSDDESSSAMIISWVDEPLSAGPSTRDAFATAVVRHFSEELDLRLALETVRVVDGPVTRIEVLGTLKEQAQVRRLLVAAFDGEPRHVVIVYSVPSGRFEEMKEALTASLDSFRTDSGNTQGPSRGVVGALAGAALGALLVSLSLWRTKKRRAANGG